MDYRSDSSRLTVTCLAPTDTPPGATAVTCDQAIFTCIRSATGQGYRIVAASVGVQRTEAAEITARAPSGDGLCDSSPQAVGVAFVPLSTGRYAVLHSTYAGKEPTGRGGQRTYTRAIVIGADGLWAFRNNPFDILRAAEAGGLLATDLTPGKSLPQVALSAGAPTAWPCFAAAMDQVGDAWLAHFIEKLLSNEAIVVLASADPLALTEAVVLAIPAPLRASVSFSAGMRFSIGRVARFNVISADGQRAQQTARGGRCAFVDASGSRTPPHPAGHPWALAAQRLLATYRPDRLVAINSASFTEADIAELERIGNAHLDLENLETADAAEVVDTAVAYVERPVESPLGEELSRQIITGARSRLDSMIARADAAAITALWQDLTASMRQSPGLCRFSSEVVRRVIARVAGLAPLKAMEMTLEAAGWFAGAPEELDRAAAGVIREVATWTASAPATELAAAKAALATWRRRFPKDATAAELLAHIGKAPAG